MTDAERRARRAGDGPTLTRTLASSAASKAFYVVSRFFVPPLVLAHVGLEEYGIWSTCFILVGYLSMTTFGVSNVYIRYTALYGSRGDRRRIAEMYATGALVTLGVGLAVLASLQAVLPWMLDLFHVSQGLRRTASWLVTGTVAIYVADISVGAVTYVLHGLNRLPSANAVWVGSVTLETVLIALLLHAGWGVWALLAALAARYAAAIVAAWIVCRRAVPELSLSPRLFRVEHLRHFVGYGGVVQLSGLLGMFLRSVEKLIAGVTLGAPAAGLLDLGEKLPGTAISIPSAMNGALLPAATYAHAAGRGDETERLYVQGTRLVALSASVVMAFLNAFAWPLMAAWLGARQDLGLIAFLMAVFTVPWHLHVVTGPASAVFRAVGRPAQELFYPLSQLALVTLAVSIGFAGWGRSLPVIAVAVGSAMAVSAIAYVVFANHRLGVAHATVARKALGPALVPYLVAGAVLLAAGPWLEASLADRWHALRFLAAAGIAYAAACALVLDRFVLDPAERQRVRGWAARIPGWRARAAAQPVQA